MMARKWMEELSVVADPWNQTETCKTEGRPPGQEIYSLYFYPFRLKAVLGKNARFPG